MAGLKKAFQIQQLVYSVTTFMTLAYESKEVISNVQPLNKSSTFNPLENVTPSRKLSER